jgi:hypothetical protein
MPSCWTRRSTTRSCARISRARRRSKPVELSSTRADFSTIAGWIAANARVLDLGRRRQPVMYLRESRGAFGYGIEIDDAGVLASMATA